jgi:hypothetical protein
MSFLHSPFIVEIAPDHLMYSLAAQFTFRALSFSAFYIARPAARVYSMIFNTKDEQPSLY